MWRILPLLVVSRGFCALFVPYCNMHIHKSALQDKIFNSTWQHAFPKLWQWLHPSFQSSGTHRETQEPRAHVPVFCRAVTSHHLSTVNLVLGSK